MDHVPDHKRLFRSKEECAVENCSESSKNSFFATTGIATVRWVVRYYRPMSEGGAEVLFYTFSVRCEDSDDGISAYIEFFDWLAQYSRTQGFVGYWQYENDEHPTLVYFQRGRFALAEVQIPPKHVDWSLSG